MQAIIEPPSDVGFDRKSRREGAVTWKRFSAVVSPDRVRLVSRGRSSIPRTTTSSRPTSTPDPRTLTTQLPPRGPPMPSGPPPHPSFAAKRYVRSRTGCRRAPRSTRKPRPPRPESRYACRANSMFPGHRQRRLLLRCSTQPGGQGIGRMGRRPHLDHPPRADRCGRFDRAVELPASDGHVEGFAGHRRGKHDRA